ncbi:MAG: hypothetical protein Q9M97_00415 [Candidatus Gracilibacteria bacterium]|nr:hypothetical protein [Candidatus Gracilibacteria bacterium]
MKLLQNILLKNDIENYFFIVKNLSGQQRLRLNQIFKEFDYLGFLQESWTLKEDFMDALDELNMTEIDRIRDDCLKSEHYRIKQFGRTIKRWYAGIKGFCEHSTDELKDFVSIQLMNLNLLML